MSSVLLLSSGNGWRKSDLCSKQECLENRQLGEELMVLHHVRRYHLHVAGTHLQDPWRLPRAIRPARASSKVDFPAPLGPIIPMSSPLTAFPEISFSRSR
ncbi:hypothetical protein LINGRAHAP2_LOCUS18704 [Linum grandiflorum]